MRGRNLTANNIGFRTVYHDVEGIKAYLRRRRFETGGDIDVDLSEIYSEILDKIDDFLSEKWDENFDDMFSKKFLDCISPLQPEWVGNEFKEYIIDGIKSCNCSAETDILNVVAENFYSLTDSQSTDYWSMVYGHIDDYVSECKCDDGTVVSAVNNNITNILDVNSQTIIDYFSGKFEYELPRDEIIELVQENFYSLTDNQSTDYWSMVYGHIDDYVSECKCDGDTVVGVINNNMTDILEFNSQTILNYFSGKFEYELPRDDILDLVQENFYSLTDPQTDNYWSMVYGHIDDYISECKCDGEFVVNMISENITTILENNGDEIINYLSGHWTPVIDVNYDDMAVKRALADQYPELDVHYILRDYHLIDKHCIGLTSSVLNIPTSDLINPSTGLERFRLLSYITSGAAKMEPLNDLSYELDGSDIYQIRDTVNEVVASVMANDDDYDLKLILSGFFSDYIAKGAHLWYGFTDLINPTPSNETLYSVMVSIDGSPNYLQLRDHLSDSDSSLNQNGSPSNREYGAPIMVPYSERKNYQPKYAELVRAQFGQNLEIVEVIPHPKLINDAERYIVLRAITDSSKKGLWEYLNGGPVINSYKYRARINKSVLKFSPLESPIAFANVITESGEKKNAYYNQQTETFKNITDLWSIDLTNFVPWADPEFDTNQLMSGITVIFPNLNTVGDYYKPNFERAFEGCTNLASIDLRSILGSAFYGENDLGGSLFNAQGLSGCPNLNYIYCNEDVGGIISANLGKLKAEKIGTGIGSGQDQDDNGYTYYYTATVEGRSWEYDPAIEALVIYKTQ